MSFAVSVLRFSKLNLTLVALRKGKGVRGVSNGDGKRQGVGRRGQVSSSLSIYLRVFHSCTILTLYFFRLSFGSHREQRIVVAGIAQGRRSEGNFGFSLFVFTLA